MKHFMQLVTMMKGQRSLSRKASHTCFGTLVAFLSFSSLLSKCARVCSFTKICVFLCVFLCVSACVLLSIIIIIMISLIILHFIHETFTFCNLKLQTTSTKTTGIKQVWKQNRGLVSILWDRNQTKDRFS